MEDTYTKREYDDIIRFVKILKREGYDKEASRLSKLSYKFRFRPKGKQLNKKRNDGRPTEYKTRMMKPQQPTLPF